MRFAIGDTDHFANRVLMPKKPVSLLKWFELNRFEQRTGIPVSRTAGGRNRTLNRPLSNT
jgi:hypothetical protein